MERERSIHCPFCGNELERISDPFSGGDFYECEKCGAVGYGWDEADQTYHVTFSEVSE